MNSKMHDKKKNFLTQEQREELSKYLDEGKSEAWISNEMNISYRQVRSHAKLKAKKQVNAFTTEEDNFIISLYSSGETRESVIAKFLGSKAPWMIRNRIKILKKYLVIPSNIKKETPVVALDAAETQHEVKNLSDEENGSNEANCLFFDVNEDPFPDYFNFNE